jgi:hypothetical protein
VEPRVSWRFAIVTTVLLSAACTSSASPSRPAPTPSDTTNPVARGEQVFAPTESVLGRRFINAQSERLCWPDVAGTIDGSKSDNVDTSLVIATGAQ